MQFSQGYQYHIYNQGNNRQKIFFHPANFLFFREKIKTHIMPFADILAYCLMPNHFHLMVEIKEVELLRSAISGSNLTHNSAGNLRNRKSLISINESIGVLLRSYTRAINIQEKRTGALFREGTKAICLNETKLSKNWFISQGVTYLNTEIPEKQYSQVCFNYIHFNPIVAKLVAKIEDWEYSSYYDLLHNKLDIVSKDCIESNGLKV